MKSTSIDGLDVPYIRPCISFIRFSAYIHHIYIVYSAIFQSFFLLSLFSLNTLFTEIYELIKALETRTSIASDLVFSTNVVLSCFFFFLIIDVYFFIPEVTAQIFDPTAEFFINDYKNSNCSKCRN